MDSNSSNGQHEEVVKLELSIEQAQALKAWVLRPAADGSMAIDEADLKPTLVALEKALEHVEAIDRVRRELEQAGLESKHLSDQQVLELGRRIAETPLRRAASA
jgi:hypothetical protein